MFMQQMVNGFSLGSMYALIAIGYTMVYGVLRLINFAHGDIMMVGGFTLQNIEEILNWTNSRAVHMSAKKISASRMEFKNPNVNMGLKGLNEYEIMDIDEEMVKAFGNFFYKISDL